MTPHRDRLGVSRVYFSPATGEHAERLATLLARVPAARTQGLDAAGVEAAWGLNDAPEHTCLAAIRLLPPGAPRGSTPASDLEALLVLTMRRALGAARSPIVALGGGLDAPLAVEAARRSGAVLEHAIHLAVPGTSYDESAHARATAAALGLELHELRVTVDELAAALPRAVRLAETPLYNLHPVSRTLVARRARALGFDALVTGDGADQAVSGAVGRADYVPIVAALTRGEGLVLASPFLDDEVVTKLESEARPGGRPKGALHALAAAWGLPARVVDAPKRSAWAPPLPRARFPEELVVESLACALDRSLAWSSDDRANVGTASLACFVHAFEIALGVQEQV